MDQVGKFTVELSGRFMNFRPGTVLKITIGGEHEGDYGLVEAVHGREAHMTRLTHCQECGVRHPVGYHPEIECKLGIVDNVMGS